MDIDQFCVLAKGQKGLACVALIQQILSSKQNLFLGKLLRIPSILQLQQSPEYAKAYATLELFAYGSWKDYYNAPNCYLNLTNNQIRKLKILSLLRLAAESKGKALSYEFLLSELFDSSQKRDNMNELEDVIIEAINFNYLQAKIDQKKRLLHIINFVGRDVPPHRVEDLLQSLLSW